MKVNDYENIQWITKSSYFHQSWTLNKKYFKWIVILRCSMHSFHKFVNSHIAPASNNGKDA